MLKKSLLISIVFFIHWFQVYSQTPSYYHYTSTDGLASSTVYDLIQDQKGYIWFATSNGISKFDGKRFNTYRTKEGLNSNSIISIVEGVEGELYIGNYEKGINVLRNGLLENYCSKINGRSFATSYLLLDNSESGNQKLYAYRSWGDINVIHEKKPTGLANYSLSVNPQHINKIVKLGNGRNIVLTTAGLYYFENDKLTKWNVEDFPDTSVYCLAYDSDGSCLVGTKGMIRRIINNRVVSSYQINGIGNNEVIAVLTDNNKNIWFSIMNKGFFLIPNQSDKIIDVGSKLDLQNTLVNNYLEDNEGNIWITTFGKGVYCLNNLYLKSFSEKDGLSSNNVYSIAKEVSGKFIIGTFNGLNILNNGKFTQVKSNTGKTLTENINSIRIYDDEIYVCGAFGGSEVINLSAEGIKFHLLVSSAFCKTGDGSFLYGQWDNSIIAHSEFNFKKGMLYKRYIIGDQSNINRINDIFEDEQKNLWIGTSLGLCKISAKNGVTKSYEKTFFPSNPVLNSRVKSISQDSNHKIWFTGEKGIASYSPDNDSVKDYASINGYDLSSSTSIVTDNRDRIWIGNMKGLYLWDGSSIKVIDKNIGLPSDEIFSLCYDVEKNHLYIGTSNGISILDINQFDNYFVPSLSVKILSIKAGDTVYPINDHLVFEPEQRNVYIRFGAICFSSPGSVKYKYNLNGKLIETDHDFLDFISLNKGKYHLQIMAKSLHSEWGKPINLNFEVKPYYYETLWFKLGRILFLVFISILLVRWRLKVKNRKNRDELELSDRINVLKHNALSAMMNPHFIFNALNSVQYLINSRQNEEANNYIAMMAVLIRKNLDTAGDGFILLSEEISRLKLYLDLEKLRFQESFSYEIIVGHNVDRDAIMIPNMIIQPFVENTLWHGIINSGMNGLVTVSFSFEDIDIDSVLYRSLIIKVTDNGIGINEARKHKKEDHISKGIQIIEERLRLLSKKMELPTPIMLEDLSNRNSISHGTEVIISLPQPLYRIKNQD